ncbi:beta-glucosidase family protein [Ascidiimonas sp. W6]|uniref:beta-glucosidase family protein n=1 Tax=Ascidiimonas meishanensis TaxID=3128903 RepID=UPI0030EC93B4
MKRLFYRILKGLVIPIALLILVLGVFYESRSEYEVAELTTKADQFVNVKTQKEIAQLAKQLVNEMTLDEKIEQLYGGKKYNVLSKLGVNILINKRFPHIYAGGNERLQLPPWVLSDGPRGARVMHPDVNAVTVFPVAMSRGASWDVDLERRVHEAIAIEMRANQINYAATPCINVLRHPGWGRAQETYGEDPWHLGSFGIAAVKAIEKHNLMACPKHFVMNSIENSRWVVNVKADERTLREVYLPQFKRTVQQGKPASIMSAYNAVNGAFCGSNKYLLTDILRNEWGFDGFVTTDWLYGLYDGVAGIKAGQNVEMPMQKAYNENSIKEALETGSIKEAEMDTLILQTLRTRIKYIIAEDTRAYTFDDIATQEHKDLALEAAEKGMVLLKNEGILPFKNESGKKILVIGRLADVANTGDKGSSDATPPYVITPYQGIKAMQEALGNEVTLYNGLSTERARLLAEEADEVIVIVGFTSKEEGEFIIYDRKKMLASAKAKRRLGSFEEGGDREDLSLPEADRNMLKALAGSNKNMVVTYIGGGGIHLPEWIREMPAILFAWYAGMEGGHALANILYGKANPSGKLPFSIAADQDDYPEFNPYTEEATYGYYHGYTLFEKEQKEVAYPFGFGLSYTNFKTQNLKIAKKAITPEDKITASIEITNTGNVAGSEVIQLYIGFKNSKVDRPVKLLRNFHKILLEPKQQQTVTLSVLPEDLKWYNPETKQWELEQMDYELYMGTSSNEKDLLQTRFSITVPEIIPEVKELL